MLMIIIAPLFILLSGCALIERARENIPAPDPETVVSNVVTDVVVPGPVTPTNSAALPFDRSKCSFHRIAADVLDWRETRTLTVSSFKPGSYIYSTCTGKDWPAQKGIQGNWGLAVDQPDGTTIIGTWDWNRNKHQTKKPIWNLNPTDDAGKPSEHAFFKLRSGARIWWFCTAFSRDRNRTVLERTNFVEARWP